MKPTIIPQFPTLAAPSGLLDRLARKAVLSRLSGLRHGRLTVIDDAGTHTFGDDRTPGALQATLRVRDPRFYREIALGGSLGAAEAYLRGYWSCRDLTSLLRLFARNIDLADNMERGAARLTAPLTRLLHWLRRNTRAGSGENIRAHYDLGNDFFALFLDETMTYSCGIFERPESTLREASLAKLDRICRKLALRPEDHVLEIGTGWGSFALHAARNYGCRVTTTTISQEQYRLARDRVSLAGLEHRIQVLLRDYRDLEGRYDKMVSIEMIEAVGHEFLETYFAKCSELLKPDGMMLLQGIVMADHRYEQYRRSVDFIQHYVFPGSCLPSVTAMCGAIARSSDLRPVHLEDLAPHYARTLRSWRERFFERIDEVRHLGYSESLIRLWEYYLCYCEAGFEERHVGDVQLLLAKPLCRRDSIVPPLH